MNNRCWRHQSQLKIEPLKLFLGAVLAGFLSNKSAQERPRASQYRPRASQERLQSAQERAKSVPRAPQERRRAPKERSRAPQERAKSAQESPKTSLKALRGTLGDYFDASKLGKRAFRKRSVAQLAREVHSERFSIDVRFVRARADTRKTCKHHRFLQVFRMSPHLRASRIARPENHRKIAKITSQANQNRPRIDQNRSSEPFSSQFG